MSVTILPMTSDAPVPYVEFQVDTEVDTGGVTDEYLAVHGDVLPANTQFFPPFSAPGDTLFCTINGVDVASMTRTLLDDDVGAKIDVEFPGEVLRQLASGEYAFTYRVERGSDIIGISRVKEILIDLTPPLRLDPPQVENGGDGFLNPMLALGGAQVHVRYQGMQAGHRVQAHWHGTAGDGTIDTAFETVSDPIPDFLSFEIAPAVVAANVGLSSAVSYTVSRPGGDATSPVLSLSVLPFKPTDMRVPQLPDLAGSDRIEPDKLPDGARVLLQPWYLAFERQQLWLWCEGEHEDRPGEIYRHFLKDGHRVTATEAQEGFDERIPATWLAPLMHGSRLIVHYQVGFHDQGRQDGWRVSFEVINPLRKS